MACGITDVLGESVGVGVVVPSVVGVPWVASAWLAVLSVNKVLSTTCGRKDVPLGVKPFVVNGSLTVIFCKCPAHRPCDGPAVSTTCCVQISLDNAPASESHSSDQ